MTKVTQPINTKNEAVVILILRTRRFYHLWARCAVTSGSLYICLVKLSYLHL
jgi:hypothetical protein